MKTIKSITYIPVDRIIFSAFNPRKTINETELKELATSIKEKGVIQPVVVRPLSEDTYEIVCGERRLRASMLADQKTIPSIIRELSDDEAMDMAITENLQRKDVNPLEEATAFKMLIEKGQTIIDLAARFGKSEMYIRGRLKLNDLNTELANLHNKGEITISHCLELCKYPDEVQKELISRYNDSQSTYYSWNGKTLKELRSSLSQYTINIEDIEFDKTACLNCKNNTAVSCLFPELEKVCCNNKACFIQKANEYQIKTCLDIYENQPGGCLFNDSYYKEKDNALINYLDDHKIPYLSRDDFHSQLIPSEPEKPNREDYENDNDYQEALDEYKNESDSYIEDKKEFDEKIDNGKYLKAYCIAGACKGKFVYIESRSSTVTGCATDPQQSAIEELNKKDIRNGEIAFEKSYEASRKHFQQALNENKCLTPISEIEEKMMYLAMIDSLSTEHRKALCNESYYLNDKQKIEIINKLTDETKLIILRDFLFDKVAGAFYSRNPKSELTMEWFRLYFPEKIAEFELTQRETYLRRKEKIDAKIAEIELENTEK